jgi:hypothetical protein
MGWEHNQTRCGWNSKVNVSVPGAMCSRYRLQHSLFWVLTGCSVYWTFLTGYPRKIHQSHGCHLAAFLMVICFCYQFNIGAKNLKLETSHVIEDRSIVQRVVRSLVLEMLCHRTTLSSFLEKNYNALPSKLFVWRRPLPWPSVASVGNTAAGTYQLTAQCPARVFRLCGWPEKMSRGPE